MNVTIPDMYVWMTEGASNRGMFFKSYVEGYLAKSYPELQLVKIEGMTAICERREGFEEWKVFNEKAKGTTKRGRPKSEQLVNC